MNDPFKNQASIDDAIREFMRALFTSCPVIHVLVSKARAVTSAKHILKARAVTSWVLC
jgi:hypothetical protein